MMDVLTHRSCRIAWLKEDLVLFSACPEYMLPLHEPGRGRGRG
jgi:hypothetical protein